MLSSRLLSYCGIDEAFLEIFGFCSFGGNLIFGEIILTIFKFKLNNKTMLKNFDRKS